MGIQRCHEGWCRCSGRLHGIFLRLACRLCCALAGAGKERNDGNGTGGSGQLSLSGGGLACCGGAAAGVARDLPADPPRRAGGPGRRQWQWEIHAGAAPERAVAAATGQAVCLRVGCGGSTAMACPASALRHGVPGPGQPVRCRTGWRRRGVWFGKFQLAGAEDCPACGRSADAGGVGRLCAAGNRYAFRRAETARGAGCGTGAGAAADRA